MPLIRKVVGFGPSSRAVVLPKSWLEFHEMEVGEEVRAVLMEVNKKLTLEPYYYPKSERKEDQQQKKHSHTSSST